jgi:hypothetical protein
LIDKRNDSHVICLFIQILYVVGCFTYDVVVKVLHGRHVAFLTLEILIR